MLQQANEILEQRVAAAVAERADAEAQLRQSQKMEAIGKLTGGVAHDFNNVLQVICGNLQLLSRDVSGNLRAEQRLQTAIRRLAAARNSASNLLAFGRRQPWHPRWSISADCSAASMTCCAVPSAKASRSRQSSAADCGTHIVDTVQVENAMLNLAINARDAMDGHGRLTIETGNAFLDDAYAAQHADVPPASM